MKPKDPKLDPKINPKHFVGLAKGSTFYTPASALLYLGEVMRGGATKYGPYNFGEAGVVASIYSDAIDRHFLAMRTGEWLDPDDGHPHAAHIMACCAILIDCKEMGNLEEDWPTGKTADVAALISKLAEQRMGTKPKKNR